MPTKGRSDEWSGLPIKGRSDKWRGLSASQDIEDETLIRGGKLDRTDDPVATQINAFNI